MSAGAGDAEAQITPNSFGDALALARTTNPAIFATSAARVQSGSREELMTSLNPAQSGCNTFSFFVNSWSKVAFLPICRTMS